MLSCLQQFTQARTRPETGDSVQVQFLPSVIESWLYRGAAVWAKSRGPVQRDPKEVMAELVGKLSQKLDAKTVSASAGEENQRGGLCPNLHRLTVGVDLGDQWSYYCILGLEGETLTEGQLRTTQPEFAKFFQALNSARVVLGVGTHSAWVREVISGYGHEVLVANPRLMEGSKRRKRKNDRIDANKLARLGRVDPKSLYPMQLFLRRQQFDNRALSSSFRRGFGIQRLQLPRYARRHNPVMG